MLKVKETQVEVPGSEDTSVLDILPTVTNDRCREYCEIAGLFAISSVAVPSANCTM